MQCLTTLHRLDDEPKESVRFDGFDKGPIGKLGPIPTEAQIVGILKQSETGTPTKELCRQHGVSPQTFYKWKAKFGGMEVSDVAKMRALDPCLRVSHARPCCSS